jgi:hypothetical protein
VPCSIGGYTACADSGDRVRPDQLTGPGFSNSANSAEFFFEQLFVQAHVVSEQRIRLCERSAAKNDFGAATGNRIERGER